MQLDPGPIPAIDVSAFSITLDQPDFEAMFSAAWAEIDSVAAEMDSLIDPTAVFDDVLTGDTIMADLDTVDQINGDNAHLANLAPIPNIDQFKANGDAGLTAAIQSTPGEAFTPVPSSTGYGTAPPAAVTANIASVTVADTTINSTTDFYTGDAFQIQVKMDTTTGQAADYYAVHITAKVLKAGLAQPDIDFGSTDSTGVVAYKGQWQAGDAANWMITVHATLATGVETPMVTYQWLVVNKPAGAPPPGAPGVTVQLTDWTSGDINNAHVGDTWQLFITGPPDSVVGIYAAQNGGQQVPAQLGMTDGAGNFNIAGKWGPGDAGDWVEYYMVGNLLWDGWLKFTVQP